MSVTRRGSAVFLHPAGLGIELLVLLVLLLFQLSDLGLFVRDLLIVAVQQLLAVTDLLLGEEDLLLEQGKLLLRRIFVVLKGIQLILQFSLFILNSLQTIFVVLDVTSGHSSCQGGHGRHQYGQDHHSRQQQDKNSDSGFFHHDTPFYTRRKRRMARPEPHTPIRVPASAKLPSTQYQMDWKVTGITMEEALLDMTASYTPA